MAETIREFLVSIGYRVDGSSEQRFERSIQRATLNAELLGRAIAATAEAVVRGATNIAKGFDEIYYASQRTQASVSNLKSLSYAVSQLGGSYGGAMASFEAFGQKLRSNPGYSSLVRSLGVATEQNGKLRDTVEITKDLAKALSQKPYYIQLQYMEALGLDERTYRALQSGELTGYVEEYRKKQQALGVDQEHAARVGKELTQAWRSLGSTTSALGERLMVDLAPQIERMVRSFDEFLVRHSDSISKVFQAMGRAAEIVAAAFSKVADFLAPLIRGLDDLAQQFLGEGALTVAMTAFAAWLTGVWLMKILGAFGLLSSGWAAMLLKLGINPLTLMAGGALALSTSPANGGEDAEIARRRADGSWGKTMTGQGGGGPAAPPQITDKRNWWQRTMPKILGGKDSPETEAKGIGDNKIPGLSDQAAADYSQILGKRESGNNYAQPGNQYGFRGRWQMGGPALADAGYVKKGTTNRGLSDPSNWTGKDGLSSLDDFLANKDGGQDKAFAAYTKINYNRLVANGTITPGMSEQEIAGWLAAAHLKGPGGARQLKDGADNVDGNGTAASSYFNMMKKIRTGDLPKAETTSPGTSSEGGLAEEYKRRSGRDLASDMAKYPEHVGQWVEQYTGKKLEDQKSASPAFNPDNFKRFQGSAALSNGGFGLSGPTPLAPGPAGGTSLDMQSKTEITILGGSDPQATAGAVADAQNGVNSQMLRNMQGAVR